MAVVVDDKLPAYDYRAALKFARKRGYPTKVWENVCNSYRNQIGPNPSRAWILMRRADVLTLDQNLHTITFKDGAGGQVKIKNLLFLRAQSIQGGVGAAGNPNALYVVEFVDLRWLCKNPFYNQPCVKQYNIRVPAGGQTYYADSLNAGVAFGWQDILNDLWTAINIPDIGASLQLPVVPTGTPENWRFLGVSAWDAYNEVLRQIGCGVTWDHQNGVLIIYTLVPVDGAFGNAIVRYANRMIYVSDYIFASRAESPEKLRVYFPLIQVEHGSEKTTNWAAGQQDQMTPLYSIDTPDPNGTPAGVQAGTLQSMFDDLPAIYDWGGALTNGANLAARATERTANFFTSIRAQTLNRTQRIFSGIISDTDLVLTRSSVMGVAYRQDGKGISTEVIRFPPQVPPFVLRLDDTGVWQRDPIQQVAQQLRPPNIGELSNPLYPPLVQPLKIVNGTPTAGAVYDGLVIRVKPADQSNTTYEQCWILSLSGSAFSVNDLVLGRMCGTLTLSASQRALYLANPGGGAVQFIKCLAAAPDGSGRFDAKIQNLDLGTLAWSDGASVWLFEANNAGQLVLNNRYLARLMGMNNGRELYCCEDFDLTVEYSDSSGTTNQVRDLLLKLQDFVLTPASGRKMNIKTKGWPASSVAGDSQIDTGQCINSITFDPNTCGLTWTWQRIVMDVTDGLIQKVTTTTGTGQFP